MLRCRVLSLSGDPAPEFFLLQIFPNGKKLLFLEKDSPLGGKHGTKLSFNSSLWNNLGGEFSYSSQDYTTSFFDFGEKYFSEQSLEISKKVSKDYNYILLFINRYYNKRLVEERTGEVNSKILVVDNTLKLNNKRSIKFDVQHLF